MKTEKTRTTNDGSTEGVGLSHWLYGFFNNKVILLIVGLIFVLPLSIWTHISKPQEILRLVIKEDNYFFALLYTLSPIAILIIILLLAI